MKLTHIFNTASCHCDQLKQFNLNFERKSWLRTQHTTLLLLLQMRHLEGPVTNSGRRQCWNTVWLKCKIKTNELILVLQETPNNFNHYVCYIAQVVNQREAVVSVHDLSNSNHCKLFEWLNLKYPPEKTSHCQNHIPEQSSEGLSGGYLLIRV